MNLKLRIAISLCLTLSILGFCVLCVTAANQLSSLTLPATVRWLLGNLGSAFLGSLPATGLVMLGVFSNTWFPGGFFFRKKTETDAAEASSPVSKRA